DEPGTAYAYGGPNFQIAGAVVERVSGQRWADYFDEVLGDPLGMTPFFWSNPAAPVPPEKVTNPVLQGGVVTTMDAYAPFLTMIAQKGVYKGRRYLSEAAIADMETVATHGVERKFVPPGAGDTHIEYNVAHWCEVEGPDGCTMLTSPGAYGFYPWVDRASGLHGIVFIQDRLNRIAADVRALRDAMIAAQTQ
ncbi:MAG: serine hydrolase, partial [Alphaproteobacteria bacterium]|nr:serine hydrolase [Alphaproteobacteria bacterium]